MEVSTLVSTGAPVVLPDVTMVPLPAGVLPGQEAAMPCSRDLGCPECGGTVIAKPYDFGVDPDTGYHDEGCRFHCLDCGAEGDEDELA